MGFKYFSENPGPVLFGFSPLSPITIYRASVLPIGTAFQSIPTVSRP